MKCRVKKSLAKERVERFRTGGGSSTVIVDEELLKILGNRATPLVNSFDSDADYHNTPGIIPILLVIVLFLYLFVLSVVIVECRQI